MEKVQITKRFLGKTVLDCDEYDALLKKSGYAVKTTLIEEGQISIFEHIYEKDGVKRYAYERLGQYACDAYGSITLVFLDQLTPEEIQSLEWFDDDTNQN